jgi:hypothetical protein
LEADDLVDRLVSAQPGRPVVVTGTHVTGALHLSGQVVRVPIEFTDCTFAEPVDLRRAWLNGLVLTGCELPAFLGVGLRSSGPVDVMSSRLSGPLDMEGAQVRGSLRLAGSTFAWVWLPRLSVGGDLDLTAAEVRSGDPDASVAVNVRGVRVDGSLIADELKALGAVELADLGIGDRLSFVGARLGPGPHPTSGVELDGSEIGHDVRFDGVAADADLRIRNTWIGGDLGLIQARWSSVSLDRVEVGGDLTAEYLQVNQNVKLRNATIGRHARFDGLDAVGSGRASSPNEFRSAVISLCARRGSPARSSAAFSRWTAACGSWTRAWDLRSGRGGRSGLVSRWR